MLVASNGRSSGTGLGMGGRMRDDIIAMARQAGIAHHGLGWTCWEGQLERFFNAAYALGAAAEREAICPLVYGMCGSDNDAERIVRAIRARGNK